MLQEASQKVEEYNPAILSQYLKHNSDKLKKVKTKKRNKVRVQNQSTLMGSDNSFLKRDDQKKL